MSYCLETLPNGVRILTEPIDSVRSAALGIWVATGSRGEAASESGAAHFIEHMLFKGTTANTAAQLAARMDAIGGQKRLYHQGMHLLLRPRFGQPSAGGTGHSDGDVL